MISFAVQNVPEAFRDRTRMRAWLAVVAKREGRVLDQLNYVLMTDKELLRYNRQYLGHDDYTDIITFDNRTVMVSPSDVMVSPSNHDLTMRGMVRRAHHDRGIQGDILISYDRVKENARVFNVPVQQELRRVMVHGLLHLCGHVDKGAAQQHAMRLLEDRYLRLFG